MRNISENFLTDFEHKNDISLIHIVIFIERKDFLKQILDIIPILTNHIDYEAPAAFNVTPIYIATVIDNLEMINLLIEAGAKLDGINYFDLSPLHMSIRLGRWKIAESLLQHGASPNYHDVHNPGMLFFEAWIRYLRNPREETEIVLVSLLRNGADISNLSIFDDLVTLDSIMLKVHKDLLAELLLAGADPSKTESKGSTALLQTVSRRDLQKKEKFAMTEMLLKAGADPNSPSVYDSTRHKALSWASFKGDTDLVILLIKWGAQTMPPPPLYSPLFTAMVHFNARLKTNVEVVNVLQENPFSPDFVENPGKLNCMTTLSLAIMFGDPGVVTKLLRRGANPVIDECSNAALCSLAEAMRDKLYSEEKTYEIMQAILNYNMRDINEYFHCENHKMRFDLLEYFIGSNYTQSIIALLERGVKIEKGNFSIDKLSLALVANDNCQVANKLLQMDYPIMPLSSFQKAQGFLNISRKCIETSRLVLRKILMGNLLASELKVDVGDEVVFNLFPEHNNNVTIMQWTKSQWNSYSLDKDTEEKLKESSLNTTVIIMRVMANYHTPFLLMTDFRMYILERISSTSPNISQLTQNYPPNIPDVFSIIKNKLSDIYYATQFYMPVLESLLQNTSRFMTIIKYSKEVVLTFGALFLVLSIPLNMSLVKYIRLFRFIKSKKHDNKKKVNALKNTEFIKCDCKHYGEPPLCEREACETSRSSFRRYNVGLVLPVLFYAVVGLINLVTYKLAKQGVNATFKQFLRSTSYSSSLWIILLLKFCNTLIIDYQPGSICAGQIFADQYNTKLAFFQAFIEHRENKTAYSQHYESPQMAKCDAMAEIGVANNCYWDILNQQNKQLQNLTLEGNIFLNQFEQHVSRQHPANMNATDILSSIWFKSNDCETDLYLDMGRQIA